MLYVSSYSLSFWVIFVPTSAVNLAILRSLVCLAQILRSCILTTSLIFSHPSYISDGVDYIRCIQKRCCVQAVLCRTNQIRVLPSLTINRNPIPYGQEYRAESSDFGVMLPSSKYKNVSDMNNIIKMYLVTIMFGLHCFIKTNMKVFTMFVDESLFLQTDNCLYTTLHQWDALLFSKCTWQLAQIFTFFSLSVE